jgi:hypothetical protein
LTAQVPRDIVASIPNVLMLIKAHPAKAGVAKPRVLASCATPAYRPATDATQDPTTAELPTKRLGVFLLLLPTSP